MPPKKTSGAGGSKAVSAGSGASGFARKQAKSAEGESAVGFQSELAVDIIEELYPLLLANCTDEDDEIDTQAVFDVLAGLMGVFMADYQESYGDEKAMAAFKDLAELALETYRQRVDAAGA